MLSEERYRMILKILEEKRSVTVTELTNLLDISESTARRDITALDKAGKLIKVFGGAVLSDNEFLSLEPTVAQKAEISQEEKRKIARYAASLIQPHDFIYLDAGTTTGYMLDYIRETDAAFVTNAVAHAQKLARNGMYVILTGGTLKSSTEAVVGAMAALMLKDYHFTRGFFGTNGVSRIAEFTTPDADEALVKKVTFGSFASASILTDEAPEEWRDAANLILCP